LEEKYGSGHFLIREVPGGAGGAMVITSSRGRDRSIRFAVRTRPVVSTRPKLHEPRIHEMMDVANEDVAS
jgi:hypothetical protein